MSFSTVLIIVFGILVCYYTGMIGYDLYMKKLAESKAEENQETPVDIGGQMDQFHSERVDRPEADTDEYQRTVEATCRSFLPHEMAELMTAVDNGEDRAVLNNLLAFAESIDSPEQPQATTAVEEEIL